MLNTNIKLDSGYLDAMLNQHKEVLSSAQSEKGEIFLFAKNREENKDISSQNSTKFNPPNESAMNTSEINELLSSSLDKNIINFVHESPQREGLRRFKPQNGEKMLGIHSSPSFGISKKLMTDFEEDSKQGDEENENTLSMDGNMGRSENKNSKRQIVMTNEQELDRRAFQSIENIVKPDLAKKKEAKETVEKQLHDISKEIDECDVLSGKFYENLMST